MIRLVLLAYLGAAAPILIMGAVPSAIVLIAAPLALIYVLAFVALTPLCGLLLWRVLPTIRFVEPIGAFIAGDANSSSSVPKSQGGPEEAAFVPAPTPASRLLHLEINANGRGRPLIPAGTLAQKFLQ